jgi:hypothetical protein
MRANLSNLKAASAFERAAALIMQAAGLLDEGTAHVATEYRVKLDALDGSDLVSADLSRSLKSLSAEIYRAEGVELPA